MNKQGRMSLILRFFKGSKRFFIVAVMASLATTILNALTPQIFRFTVDSVLGGDGQTYSSSHLWMTSLLLIAIGLLSGGALFLNRTYTAKSGENFAKNLRDTLFFHVQRLPIKWHDQQQTGDIIQRCTSDVEVIRNFVVSKLSEVFRTIFLVVISFGMMMSMNVGLSLLSLVFVPIVVVYSTIFYRLIAKMFTLTDEAEGELSTVVQENATGVRVVRAFGRENFELERFQKKNEDFAKKGIRLGTLMGLYWGVGDLITGLQVISIVAVGAMGAIKGNITVGEFIAFASYNTTLVWPVRGLGRVLSDMSKAGVSFERVNYILNAREEPYSGEGSCTEKTEASHNIHYKVQSYEIAFSNVNFAYDAEKEVLKNINFAIPQGSVFGILGGTGSGKSTVIQLLNRLYELSDGEGEISLGGENIKDIPIQWLRKNIGVVLQEPFLYSRTIRENIVASVPDADMEDIREAARVACVDEAIMSFTDGYDTVVGERGVTLSGGQRQRIAIARMILQKTPIMIFDDSLSAVDSETDSKIRKSLSQNRKGITVILVSHRITTLMEADQIMVLHQGSVEEVGSHMDLISRQGSYRNIYDIQMSQKDRMQMEG